MAERDIAVLVLAGGAGRRIGGAKPQRLLRGATLLDRALARARGYGAQVAVGVRDKSQTAGATDVECVLDAEGIAGPLASLAAGLRWARDCGAEFLLTVPCDAPFLPSDLAVRLRERVVASSEAAATPVSFGRMHPACSLWRTDLEDRLRSYAAGGRSSLNGFADFVSGVTVDWAEASPDPFYNINTASDLAAAETFEHQPHLE